MKEYKRKLLVQKSNTESPGPIEKEVKSRKNPIVSCDKYDEAVTNTMKL
ncbi:hypothetical protein [Methanosarcina barkeri]|nr:hypothetical protein [Methanosarcina barkeri]